MDKHQKLAVAGDALRLYKLCYDKDGKCTQGLLWNQGTDLIRARYKIDMQMWNDIKKEFVEPVLQQLKGK